MLVYIQASNLYCLLHKVILVLLLLIHTKDRLLRTYSSYNQNHDPEER
jgi:hypothetical protein